MFRLLIICGLAAAALGAGLSERSLVHRVVKRQAAMAGMDLKEMDGCTIGCVMSLGLSMMKEMQDAGLDMSDMAGLQGGQGLMSAGLNESFITSFCGAYQKEAGCLDKCPPSKAGDAMGAAFGVLDYACVDNYDAFMALVPCMNKVGDEMEKTCEGKCGDSGKAVMGKIKMQAKTGDLDKDQMMQEMQEACGSMNCMMSCAVGVVEAKCPEQEDASEFMRGMIEEVMHSLDSILQTAGNGTKLPEDCLKAVEAEDEKPQADQPPAPEPEAEPETKPEAESDAEADAESGAEAAAGAKPARDDPPKPPQPIKATPKPEPEGSGAASTRGAVFLAGLGLLAALW